MLNILPVPGFDGYGALATRLRALADELCDGKLVFVLEGGYHLTALPWGVRRVLELLLDETPTPDPLGAPANPSAPDISQLLSEMRRIHGLD